VHFGKDGSSKPTIKRFLSEIEDEGVVCMTVWHYSEVGENRIAAVEVKAFNEADPFYVTTQNLTRDQLQHLSDEVGGDRSLLVMCRAFRGRKEGYGNLTVKKIPNAVLSRCEWGKDDYSLKVENLPKAPPAPGQMELISLDGDETKQPDATGESKPSQEMR
jgi:hypothetical protein